MCCNQNTAKHWSADPTFGFGTRANFRWLFLPLGDDGDNDADADADTDDNADNGDGDDDGLTPGLATG